MEDEEQNMILSGQIGKHNCWVRKLREFSKRKKLLYVFFINATAPGIQEFIEMLWLSANRHF